MNIKTAQKENELNGNMPIKEKLLYIPHPQKMSRWHVARKWQILRNCRGNAFSACTGHMTSNTVTRPCGTGVCGRCRKWRYFVLQEV